MYLVYKKKTKYFIFGQIMIELEPIGYNTPWVRGKKIKEFNFFGVNMLVN